MKIFRLAITTIILNTLCFTSYSQEKEWQHYFGFGYSLSFEDLQRDDPIEMWQGYSSSFQRVDKSDFGHGFYLNYEISNGRWIFPAKLGINIWRNNIYGIKNRLNPQGQSIGRSKVQYKDFAFYGQLSIGAGFNLLNSSQKLAIIPLIQLNPEISFGKKININSGEKFVEDYFEFISATDLIDSDTAQYQNTGKYLLALRPSIGLDLRYAISEKTTIRIGASYYWQNFSRTTFGNIKRRTHGVNCNIGFLFKL